MVWQQQQRGVHESSPRSMLVVQYVIYFNFLKVAAQALDCDTTEADGLTDERKGVGITTCTGTGTPLDIF
jgi:hypothetical protein